MNPQRRILSDLGDDDRGNGMGIVVEYAGRTGKPQWVAPAPFRWSYAKFAKPGAAAPAPDETFEMSIEKHNAADMGFNRWTINGVAFPMTLRAEPAAFHLHQGKRYRIHMRNASDDIHPVQAAPPHVRADSRSGRGDRRCDEGHGNAGRIPGN